MTSTSLWKQTVDPTPVEEIIPNTITLPPPNFTVFLTHFEEISIPYFTSYKPFTIGSKQVEFRFIAKLNPIPLILCPHDMLCGEVETNLLIFFEIKSLRHRNRATNFSLFNLWETVFLEIGFPVWSQNAWEIDAVLKWSFEDILTIIRSSRLGVIGGLGKMYIFVFLFTNN